MASHSSILAWEIPWTEEPVGYSLWGCKESDTTEVTEHSTYNLQEDSLPVLDIVRKTTQSRYFP